MDAVASLPADAQAAEAVEPGGGAFDDAAEGARAGAVRLSAFGDHGPGVDFEVRQDERSTQEAGDAGGVGAGFGEGSPVLEVGETVLDRCASDGEDAVGFLLAQGELVSAAGGVAGDDHGVEHVVVQAAEAEVGQRPEAGGAQVGQDVVVAGGGVVVGAAGPGGGYPDQASLLVSQGEEVQAVAAVLAGVVPPVGLASATLGADEGAVDQDHLPTLLRDLLQGAIQARRPGGEQPDQLVAPGADGGLGHVVSAGHVGQTLVMAQHGQHDHRDLPRRQDPPPGPNRLQMTPEQVGEVVDGACGQRQTALTVKRTGVLGILFGFRHTIPTAAGGNGVTRAAPLRAALDGLAPRADASQPVRGVSPS
ncbi:hypothetical protein GCM10015536_45610 [Streptomyces griseomycini]|nr:hypothetical protein GCM10015536_45610 [Streptomyces griseomycini]